MVDVVATMPGTGHFSRLEGRAWCLGQWFDWWEPAAALAVWRNPLIWLQNGAEGVVILDWQEAYWHLTDRSLVAEDEIQRRQIQNLMVPTNPTCSTKFRPLWSA